MENKKILLKRIIMLVTASALLVSACTFGAPDNDDPSSSSPQVPSSSEQIDTPQPPEENPKEENIDPPDDIIQEPEVTEPDEKDGEEEIEEKPEEKPKEDPLRALYSDKDLKEQWRTIDDVSSGAQKYYTENFNQTRIVTKDGYLYNYAADELVDVNYLISEGFLDSKYANKGCDVLLLDAEQMKKYSTLRINSSETGLTVFAAMRNPKDGSYLMATSKSAGGYLTSTQYAALLNGYYQDHGTYGTLYKSNQDYSRIISFISMYEGKYEDYCVRSVTKDNKYALVTLSSKSNTASVKQYILRRNGNIWEVVMDGIENETRVAVAINKKIPDFNLRMLPDYIIKDHKNSLNKPNDLIVKFLKIEGIISDAAEIKYISSTKDFGYVVLKNEVKYLCLEDDDDWTFTKCASSADAEKMMKDIRKSAPTFIILDS